MSPPDLHNFPSTPHNVMAAKAAIHDNLSPGRHCEFGRPSPAPGTPEPSLMSIRASGGRLRGHDGSGCGSNRPAAADRPHG